MASGIDAFAGALLRLDGLFFALGAIALIAGVALALVIQRRRALYWSVSALLASTAAFSIAGLAAPLLLIGPLGTPVILIGGAAALGVLPYAVLVLGTGRPERVREAAYGSCALVTAVGAAALVVAASASV